MVWLGRLDPNVALAWRACAGAAGVLAVLTLLGYAPSRLLCRGALRPYRWPLAPLLGWMVLTLSGYLLMTTSTFGPALTITTAAALAADAALVFPFRFQSKIASRHPHPPGDPDL